MVKFSLNSYEVNDYEKISVDFGKVKDGNQLEKEKLVKKYLRLIKKVATNPKKGLDEDLLQELLLNMFENVICKFDVERDFYKYLSQALTNKKIRYFKEKNKNNHKNLEDKCFQNIELLDQLKDDFDIENNYLNNRKKKYLNYIISSLDRENEKIIKLYYGIDCPSYTLREISDKVELSFNGVKFRLDEIKSYFKSRVDWDNFV